MKYENVDLPLIKLLPLPVFLWSHTLWSHSTYREKTSSACAQISHHRIALFFSMALENILSPAKLNAQTSKQPWTSSPSSCNVLCLRLPARAFGPQRYQMSLFCLQYTQANLAFHVRILADDRKRVRNTNSRRRNTCAAEILGSLTKISYTALGVWKTLSKMRQLRCISLKDFGWFGDALVVGCVRNYFKMYDVLICCLTAFVLYFNTLSADFAYDDS